MIKGDCDNADDDNDSNYSCANGNNEYDEINNCSTNLNDDCGSYNNGPTFNFLNFHSRF